MDSMGHYKTGRTMAGPLDFASYKRPQSVAESNNGQMPAENLGDLLGQVSKNSAGGINDLIGDFERLREKLQTDAERIQRDVAEYRTLSEQVLQLTKTVAESVDKVRGPAER
jgi:methyl-accepting chemotaxis protein